MSDDNERLARHLGDWIAAQVTESGGRGVVFGLSGGVDSAVVTALCKRAFPHYSLGLVLPCDSDPVDAADAVLTAHHFGLPTTTIDLTPVYETLCVELRAACSDTPDDRLTCANVKPRLRMTALYAFSNHLGYRVVGTGNRSELAIGYFTKWGDGGVDLLPLGNLTKTRVRELACHLGVPQRIVDKPPSAGLWEGQSDEGEMGITYEQLDACLEGGGDDDAREVVERLDAAARHKRELPPIAPLPSATDGSV